MIAIAADSSAYFKKSEARQLGVRLIPLNYTVDGQIYNESFSDQNGDFENLLKSGREYTTAHPNIATFLSCFEEELQNNNEVLCITMSSRLSGAYSTAHTAAKQAASGNVAVFDSQLTAGGLYLLVKEARKLIDSGLDLKETLKKLPEVRDKITIAFSVDDMRPLRKSGRIGFVRLNVGTFLNIKPILLCREGAVVADGVARGNNDVIKRLSGKINADTKEAVISYVGDGNTVSDLYHTIKARFPRTAVTLQKIGPVLGIHLGLSVIAVSSIQ